MLDLTRSAATTVTSDMLEAWCDDDVDCSDWAQSNLDLVERTFYQIMAGELDRSLATLGPVARRAVEDEREWQEEIKRIRQPIAAVPGGLPLIETARWDDDPPDHRWIVDGWLLRQTVGLLIGTGGIGKSILGQQLATCCHTARPFLGLPVASVPAIYLTAEDPEPELRIRQRAINAALGLDANAAPALCSLAGHEGAALGHFDARDGFVAAGRLAEIETTARATGAGLIVLDHLGHLFGGDENKRAHVAEFIAALGQLAVRCDAAVLLLGHPNKAGAQYSGVTGWNDYVRQRWFMTTPRGKDRGPGDPRRMLTLAKSNYGRQGAELALRFVDRALIPADAIPAEIAAQDDDATDESAFLACLAARTAAGKASSDKLGKNYAPARFADMAEAGGAGRERLTAAMTRLVDRGAIAMGVLPWRDASRREISGLATAAAIGAAIPAQSVQQSDSEPPQSS